MKTFQTKTIVSALFLMLVTMTAAGFYDPTLQRWINRDPIGERGGINLYGYGDNNPLRFIDALGLLVSCVYDQASGVLTCTDIDTGEKQDINAESGGKPYGDPIPAGNYDILDHPKPDFFRLEPLDNRYGDDKDDRTGRNEFRLHRPGRTIGCIAAKDADPWKKLRDMIRNTKTTLTSVESKSSNPFASDKELIKRFGDLKVIDTRPSAPIPRVPLRP